MRKFTVLGVLILLFFGTTNVFSQQLLWTSSKEITDAKYIPLDSVKNRVMEYYDNNEYYVDNTGYDVNYFLKIFKLDSKIGVYKKRMKERNIKKLVFCVKTNPGNGSIISLLILSEKNFDMVSFSDVLSSGSQHSYPDNIQKRTKFEKWIKNIIE
jgi:hypothetical protein